MFQKGERIFMAGAAGEPTALVGKALQSGVHLFTTFVPGINELRATDMAAETRITGLFAQPILMRDRPASIDRMPVSYGGFLKLLRNGLRFDTTVIQVAPPDARGQCSLGPMAEFSIIAARQSRRTIAIINENTPALPGSPHLPMAGFDAHIEADTPLATYSVMEDSIARKIADHVMPLLPDLPVIQLGLGKIPNALTAGLSQMRDLRFHSGMLSDGIVALHAAGALMPGSQHLTTALLGSKMLYDWARDHPEIGVAGCDEIHDLSVLSGIDRLVAINSAIEVDLAGQCDLEFAGTRAISGPGGAPDFARAAALSRGGCSIVALPASANGASRIVPQLSSGHATLGRCDVDFVVTEHGVADLRGKSVAARRDLLISIAAPESRASLDSDHHTEFKRSLT